MTRKVLHILSQRPALTGSGVTLDALVRHAGRAGWDQRAIVGTPATDPNPPVGDLPPGQVLPLVFETGPLRLRLPGMSDVMPYPSSRFASLDPASLAAYRAAWLDHIRRAVAEFAPDVIHAHHVWLVGALLADAAPGVPVLTHCHGTGLRQLELCPHLSAEVTTGCARNARFAVLHRLHARELGRRLAIEPERIHVVGAGYRDDLFQTEPSAPRGPTLAYVGKYSRAKGLPWLLDAVERLRERIPRLQLHVAGSGAGPEAEAIAARMDDLGPAVVRHGQLDQAALADLLRSSAVTVLPSFFEGLPLVLTEAAACGCRLVSTALPGVVEQLAPHLGERLELVPLPGLVGPDEPIAADLPAFVDRLTEALERALTAPPTEPQAESLQPFTWGAVFDRVERIWLELAG